ncbi:hypothetical protein BCB4264_A1873 [Bacillus cereus B4264]|uniref:Uncharacterized protein n=1 Tax=Bacillus cereus (strain B4264) TaxID=405532 RepID=B7HIQ9_BACC4|nr:hypothetical protein BCB4264_A1873 [Bacillus cereus B4264]
MVTRRKSFHPKRVFQIKIGIPFFITLQMFDTVRRYLKR